MNNKHPTWMTWVICLDGEPLEEHDGTITLYRIEDSAVEEILKDRFFNILCLIADSSRVTLKKFTLSPETFENELSTEEFKKKAQETKESY
jgi:hypothetical protein